MQDGFDGFAFSAQNADLFKAVYGGIIKIAVTGFRAAPKFFNEA